MTREDEDDDTRDPTETPPGAEAEPELPAKRFLDWDAMEVDEARRLGKIFQKDAYYSSKGELKFRLTAKELKAKLAQAEAERDAALNAPGDRLEIELAYDINAARYVGDARSLAAKLKPFAKLDGHTGRVLIETDDGPVTVENFIPPDRRFSKGGPGSGGKKPSELPAEFGDTTRHASVLSQKEYERLSPPERQAIVARGGKR